MHNILIFTEIHSYLNISMEEQLKALGYNIINVGTNMNEINAVKDAISAIMIYADSELIKKLMDITIRRKCWW